MERLRHLLVERLYEYSKLPYKLLFKKKPAWGLTVKQLLQYRQETLGYHLGCFLLRYHFTPEPQLEDHDIYHVLTGSGISVPDEIAMQFYLFGNGKRSLYLFMVLLIGSILFYDELSKFKNAYQKGKAAHRFYDLNFIKLLSNPVKELQYTFKITLV